ncbi:hypothetical protein ACSQ67_001185 [Phaseolus vulgaris]
MDEIRKVLGVCPQHDILFPELTVRRYECYSNKGKQVKEGDAQMALGDSDDSDSYHVLLMVTTSNCTKSNSWYLDPRCSNHITGNRVKSLSIQLDIQSGNRAEMVLIQSHVQSDCAESGLIQPQRPQRNKQQP